MSPEEQLKFIEGVNAVADAVDSFRSALVERGWNDGIAQSAAVTLYMVERARS